MKAQAHQNQSNFGGLSGLMGGQVGDFFKNDPLALLQSNFSDLSMNKDQMVLEINLNFNSNYILTFSYFYSRVDQDSKQVNNHV